MPEENRNIIECDNLVKIYKTRDIEVVALQGLDLTISEGEITAIIGKSGSGKSSLLNIIAGLDRPSAGKICVDGKDLLKFNDRQLMQYNRDTIGFVWQNNARNLIPYLTACQNVEIPMMITGTAERRDRARSLLDMVGLENRHNSRLHELSGGEQQRVAIAIALANEPRILLADEPTGSVDSKTAYKIMNVFNELNSRLGLTVLIVTHDMKATKLVNRVVSINDGIIGGELLRKEEYAHRLSGMNEPESLGESHNEYTVLDRKGRIRIPEELLGKMGLSGGEKLKVVMDADGLKMIKE